MKGDSGQFEKNLLVEVVLLAFRKHCPGNPGPQGEPRVNHDLTNNNK